MIRTTQAFSLLTLMFFALAALPFSARADEAATPNLVVHLGHYSDDLHSASMGMSLARLLQKKGANVTVFLDREGVRLADARGPKDLRWGDTRESVVEIFSDFLKKGGSVLICPHCAEAVGLSADSVRSGARIASQDEVAALFLNADRVIDY